MIRKLLILLALPAMLCLSTVFAISPRQTSTAGYVLERDADVAKNEPGPHNGGGPSTGYVFFDKAPNLKFSFRKRVLHKGAAIGYHLQKTDEVYYFTGGQGEMTINGKSFDVRAGDAVLTRGGSSHGLVQRGVGDLTIIITFQKE
jgi:mannose-6-phosphate isomerase-like protein (cupin superfamily)